MLLVGGGSWYNVTHPFDDRHRAIHTSSIAAPSQAAARQRATPDKNDMVTVYFSKHPESDDDPTLTFPVRRAIEANDSQVTAIAALITGPTVAESNRGYFSSVRLKYADSNCDHKDFALSVKGGTTKLVLCKPFDHTGALTDAQAIQSLKMTLGQFENIQETAVYDTGGNCIFPSAAPELCKPK